MKYIFTLCALVMLFVSFGVQAKADVRIESFEHQGITRSYRLYIPDMPVSQLLIVLHPSGSSARAMELITGFDDLADEYGFAVLYPDSYVYNWNDGRTEAGILPHEEAVDDVDFLISLVDELVTKFELDPEQVYLTGLENGGLMAYRAACENPERYAAVIPVAAMMWQYQVDNCGETTSPVDMFIIHGAEHPNYIEEGDEVEYLLTGDVFRWLGWQETIDFWLERNQCSDEGIEPIENSSLKLYQDCENDSHVAFWAIPVAGYNWARMANNSINRFGVDISQVIAAYLADKDWQSMTVPEGAETELARSYFLYIPESYDPATATPLVVNLHGRLSNAAAQAYTSDFNRIADREGIIVLYPNAIDTEWNYLYGLVSNSVIDDEAFLGALIDDISQDLNIDANRVYVTGLSNGGFMTGRLACTMSDRFAAFAPVAATLNIGAAVVCDLDNPTPIPILYIHGSADEIVPASGVRIMTAEGNTSFASTLPLQTSIIFWADNNGCDTNIESEVLPLVDPETETVVVRLKNCPEDAPVILYAVMGGGHVWHGTHEEEYDYLGQNSQDFNASEVIWDFFSQFTLEGRVED